MGNQMFTQNEAPHLIGADLFDAADAKVGPIRQVFLDDKTGQPAWVTVRTRFFGTSEGFVPLAGARRVSAGVSVPYSTNELKGAPRVEVENGHLDEADEAALCRHYRLPYSQTRTRSERRDTAPPSDMTDLGDGETAVIRSEEELHVGTEQVHTGRARLRKYVVTEEQTITVPVKKEKVRLETLPATGEDPANAVPITEAETEVTLSEERPVVTKETVAKEKVRLVKEVDFAQETVTASVRKERVEVDGDETDGPVIRKN